MAIRKQCSMNKDGDSNDEECTASARNVNIYDSRGIGFPSNVPSMHAVFILWTMCFEFKQLKVFTDKQIEILNK